MHVLAILSGFLLTEPPPQVMFDFGGPRKVVATINSAGNEYLSTVQMLPIRAYDPVTNDRLNRDYGRQIALQALVKHLIGDRTGSITVSGVRVEKAGLDGNVYALTLRVSKADVVVVRPDQPTPATPRGEVVAFTSALFTRVHEYRHTLERLRTDFRTDLADLQSAQTKNPDPEVFALGIATLESRFIGGLETLAGQVRDDELLLFTERDDLRASISAASKAILVTLQRAVKP